MRSALADVVMHVNENLNEEAMLGIELDMRRDENVVSVGHRPGRSHLMMVIYDSEVARAASILAPLHAQGLHVQVIG